MAVTFENLPLIDEAGSVVGRVLSFTQREFGYSAKIIALKDLDSGTYYIKFPNREVRVYTKLITEDGLVNENVDEVYDDYHIPIQVPDSLEAGGLYIISQKTRISAPKK
ncbi:MAG: hypothetical protein QXG36_07500 [Nitrososphaeria archaeon]